MKSKRCAPSPICLNTSTWVRRVIRECRVVVAFVSTQDILEPVFCVKMLLGPDDSIADIDREVLHHTDGVTSEKSS